MATSGVSSLKLLGVGLALAVLIDATLVRALLVPAIMRLAGHANTATRTRMRTRAGLMRRSGFHYHGSRHVLTGTPRRRENGVGLPATSPRPWDVIPYGSLTLGL